MVRRSLGSRSNAKLTTSNRYFILRWGGGEIQSPVKNISIKGRHPGNERSENNITAAHADAEAVSRGLEEAKP